MQYKLLGFVVVLIISGVLVSGCTSNGNTDNRERYNLGNSTFLVPPGGELIVNNNGTDGAGITKLYKDGLDIMITQYGSSLQYNADYKQSAKYHQVNSLNMTGLPVKFMSSPPTYLYYFHKRGKFYCLGITDTSWSVATTDNDFKRVNETATSIINSMN